MTAPGATKADALLPVLRILPTDDSVDPQLTEIELLGQRCRIGDTSAWNALFPIAWPVLVTFANRLYHSLDEQDAEDVAQVRSKRQSVASRAFLVAGFSAPGCLGSHHSRRARSSAANPPRSEDSRYWSR